MVSIVTPFYNTRGFLGECIESVLAQTYRNWEYVLVDNQSTDGSSEIARDYASRFPAKVRLVRTQSFLSQVQNYNFALTLISPQSKYCKMVQADDRIYPECLTKMVEVAESDSSIGLVCSYRLRGNRVTGDGIPCTQNYMTGAELSRLQLNGPVFTFGSPTTVLYRAESVRATVPFYDESTLHDDTDACYRILQKWNFGFVHQVLSFNRFDNESISSRVRDYQPALLDSLLQLHKFGPVYFEPKDFATLFRQREQGYYRFLAHRRLLGASKEFWKYHETGLKTGGLNLDKPRLWRYISLEVLRLLSQPFSTCARLYERFRARGRDQPNSMTAR
jgi:glycosyltransferase involved in cell wall biosynthesis